MEKLLYLLKSELGDQATEITVDDDCYFDIELKPDTDNKQFLKKLDSLVRDYLSVNRNIDDLHDYVFDVKRGPELVLRLDYADDWTRPEGYVNINGRETHVQIFEPFGDSSYFVYDDEFNNLGGVYLDDETVQWSTDRPILEPVVNDIVALIFHKS